MMKNKIAFSLLIFLTTSLVLTAQNKKAVSDFVANSNFKYASISLSVKKLSGEDFISYNPKQSLTPASTLKVITTASALELLGSDFKFKTTLGKDLKNPNQLIVHGYGDPTLGSEYLDQDGDLFLNKWSESIKKAYTSTEKLEIKVFDSYFGYEAVSRKWQREDIGNYYAPGSYGISVFDNSYKLYLSSLSKNSIPKVLKTEPNISNLSFQNSLSLNTTGRDNGYIVGDPMVNDRMLLGDIPAGRSSFVIKGSIPNPGLFLAESLSAKLKTANIPVTSVSTSLKDYYKHINDKNLSHLDSKVFYTHYSPSLADIVRQTNERSNNHYAEYLIRTLGRNKNTDVYSNPLEEGIEAIVDLWKSKGLDTEGLFLHDGSGLAPANAVNAEFLTDILVYMYSKSKHKDAFFNSLPKAGEEGTVRSFLRGTRLSGKVFVKSGSIAGVQSYSGYYINGVEKYAFTIIINRFTGTHREARNAIEKLLLGIF